MLHSVGSDLIIAMIGGLLEEDLVAAAVVVTVTLRRDPDEERAGRVRVTIFTGNLFEATY